MKHMKKKIFSFVLAAILLATAVGSDWSKMDTVKAAENPKYLAKLVKGGGRVVHNLPCEANTIYTLTFNYYVDTEATQPNLQARFQGSVISGTYQNVGDGEFDGRNTGYGSRNRVCELTVKYQTPETIDIEKDWLGFILEVTSDVDATYYIWNVKVCKSNSIENLVRNADFTESSSEENGGTWIGWQMAEYNYVYISDVDASKEATSASGNTIISYDRNTYTWLPDYSALPYYEWDSAEKTLTFMGEMEFDLTTVTDYHLYEEGKAFIGWKDQNGNWLTKEQASTATTFAKNTVLTAQYMDYNQDSSIDFAITSEEMRTEGTLGLRYIVELSNNLKTNLPGAGEYGTIVLPSEILDGNTKEWTMTLLHTKNSSDWYNNTYSGTWADLTYDGTYTYNGEAYSTTVVEAKNTYKTAEDRIYYTLCITNLTEEKGNYDRQYTVKGYIKYVDNNDVERILYTDYASTNSYLVSDATLGKAEVSEDAKALLTSIVANVNTKYETTRTALEQNKQTITSDLISTYRADVAGENEVHYQLKNGLKVREVTFDFGLGLSDNPLEVIHLSDLHYSYMNQYDFAEAYHTLLATYDVRNGSWPAIAQGGLTTEAGKKLLEYARTSDQLVVTGDVMDYLSHGAAELAHREIWDKYPSTLMTLGNHEISQKVSDSVEETLSSEVRYNWLTQVWEHDHTYMSQMLGDQVKLVLIDNSANTFFEEQYAKLESDIREAKDNGYKILMFMHEPLVTGNSKDTAVPPIWVSDNKTQYDFYTNKPYSNVFPGKNDATNAVYDLITANADVIKGIFNGHIHNNFYSEIIAKDNQNNAIIPQYTVGAGFTGDLIKIVIK